MFRSLCLTVFCFQIITCFAQSSVKIEFSPGCNGDYDIYLKEAFESAGYRAFVNYNTTESVQMADFKITYAQRRNKITVSLYKEDNIHVRDVEKPTNRLQKWKPIEKAVSDLLNKEIDISNGKTKEPTGFNYSAEVNKIDSAVYIITASGAEVVSQETIEKLFFNVADYMLTRYKVYSENSDYAYTSRVGIGTYSYTGKETSGIIIGIRAGSSPQKLTEAPEEYLAYRKKEIADNNIPVPNTSIPQLIVFRSADYNFSARPFNIFIDGVLKCHVKNGSYSILKIDEGAHMVVIQIGGKKVKARAQSIRIVHGDENTYIESMLASSYGGVNMQKISELKALKLMKSTPPLMNCD